MKISENTRPARAGKQEAESLIETVHLFFLNDNALQYLQALIKRLEAEFERRKAEREEAKP